MRYLPDNAGSRRPDHVRGRGRAHGERRDAAEVARRPDGDGLPGPGHRPQSVDQGRRADRRGVSLPQAAWAKSRRWPPPSRCSRRCRSRHPTGWTRRYPHELSGGQQQRIMFAMALATDPDLLVLDEPTTGLDATVEAEVLDLVEQLRTQFNTSILFVSHNLGIVARMCERVGVLYAGRLIEEGPARELFQNPRHPYTLALLRCMPRMGMSKDVDRLDPIPGSLPPLGRRDRRLRLRRPLPDRARPLPGRAAADRAGDGRARRPLLLPRGGAGDPASAGGGGAGAGRGRRARLLLEVDELVKAYGAGANEVVAVAGVDIEVGRGEVLGLVGESGSGKTSLAKCIVGLIDPSDGTIEFDAQGRDEGRCAAARPRRSCRWCSRIPTTRSTRATRSARSCAARWSCWPGSGARRSRTRSWRSWRGRCGWSRATWTCGRQSLSGGLKQRVAIARSFAGKPVDGAVRRADLGARRLGAGRDPEPARRPPARAGRVLRVHLPRPGRRPLRGRPDRGDVPGPDRRRRAGDAVFRRRTTPTPRRCSRPSPRSTSTRRRA